MRWAVSFVLIGTVLISAVGYVWYNEEYLTPERRFWSAIDTAMSVPSVTRTLEQGASGNQLIQHNRFHFAPQQVIEGSATVTEASATVRTNVRTEGLIYPTEQYLRYTAFESTRDGIEYNIDDSLNRWSSELPQDPDFATQEYLNEQVSVAIFGNFASNQRSELRQLLEDDGVYEIVSSEEMVVDEEEAVVYQVAVRLRRYVQALNTSFVAAGYGELADLSPEFYDDEARLNTTFTLRKRDNAFVEIQFGDRIERYSNYGVIKEIITPQPELTIEDLQENVQQALAQ